MWLTVLFMTSAVDHIDIYSCYFSFFLRKKSENCKYLVMVLFFKRLRLCSEGLTLPYFASKKKKERKRNFKVILQLYGMHASQLHYSSTNNALNTLECLKYFKHGYNGLLLSLKPQEGPIDFTLTYADACN